MRRQLQPRKTTDETQVQAISDRPLAIVARQSTTKQTQENTESLKLQVEDARERFIKQGWSQDIITMHIAGGGVRGVSGTLRIDQRQELIDTIAGIKAGEIKAVGAYSVSRLFRDKWGIQSGAFMRICAEYDVLLILPTQTFDFNKEQDRMMFQLQCSVASMENEQRAKLMSEARQRKAMRGEYDGRPLMAGFIVDRDKTSATYGHFIVYEPHASVVRRLYKRYRELGGRFNLLASEVAAMAVVFPDFEEWVDPLNVSRLKLRKVVGGYHMSRVALYNLMVAVEYMGYWKVGGIDPSTKHMPKAEQVHYSNLLVDSDNNPLVVHDAIVDSTDWNYAYTRLSWNNLDGSVNTKRVDGKDGWVQADKKTSALLQGILTSTQGTVRYSNGIYNVAELRPGKSQRSNTLSVQSGIIDLLFSERISQRALEMYDAGNGDFIQKQLEQTRTNNARALVSVDEQIKTANTKINSIRAFILATGATADTATLQGFNEQLLGLSATLADLQAKKKAAAVEESGLSELAEMVKARRGLYTSERFIRLACESISLDEYSQHFVTLTINWCEPFKQTDVCFIYREDAGKVEWTDQDTDDLRALYPHSDRLELLQRFPARSWLCIMSYACDLKLKRDTRVNTSGITNRVLSLLDHNLLADNGWELEDKINIETGAKMRIGHWWINNTTDINTADATSGQGRYSWQMNQLRLARIAV